MAPGRKSGKQLKLQSMQWVESIESSHFKRSESIEASLYTYYTHRNKKKLLSGQEFFWNMIFDRSKIKAAHN